MPPDPPESFIRLRDIRQNNLKGFDLDLPLHRLIVVTGPSGSGKSSLAFDTLFAEGQRRYIETFSPYARQFFDRMDKPAVERIENIPPAIAIQQTNSVKTSRSTVGTMTEICDYLKNLWPRISSLYCDGCGRLVESESPERIWAAWQEKARSQPALRDALVTFALPLSDKLSLGESLHLISRQGYQRLLIGGSPPKIIRIEEALAILTGQSPTLLTIIQDRLALQDSNKRRFVEACEQAYHFGQGKLRLEFLDHSPSLSFSNRLHCPDCDREFKPPSPGLFSFNNPAGACPVCRGFGRTISIDYHLAIPDRGKSLAQGAVKPWQTGQGLESQKDLLKMCRHRGIPVDIPFQRMSEAHQTLIIEGDPHYGDGEENEWPRAWYGIKGYFRYLEARTYKMHVRVLLSRYRCYRECDACGGSRFQPYPLQFKSRTEDGRLITLGDFYQMPIVEALRFIERFPSFARLKRTDPLRLVRDEVQARLSYLIEAGLGYLTLHRTTRTLSGGEVERVNLATCLGTRLVNALFVLDEPSVGLHARDTAALVRILQRLRDAGNTVLVVEHEPAIIRAADELVDLGPGQGETGGELIFQGPFGAILKDRASLTGDYLSGRKTAELPFHRPVETGGAALSISGANLHNLKNLSVKIPLERFVCLTGVSGSGKSTLLRDVLAPLVRSRLTQSVALPADAGEGDGESERSAANGCANLRGVQLEGSEALDDVLLIDQTPAGKTPRSNPALYVGAFDLIRELFAQSPAARRQNFTASAFSFNAVHGRCEQCAGAGFERIEMQFLSDVFIRCSACQGRRYQSHILEIKLAGAQPDDAGLSEPRLWSIADLLDATIDDCLLFLRSFAETRPGRRAIARLRILQELGLGYLRMGQPVTTLSGGESQRLKLAAHLAEAAAARPERMRFADAAEGAQLEPARRRILLLFDEPTTGLHFSDVTVLLKVFQKLVSAGHSLVVIEHNLEVIASADWVIDLGPEGGEAGGRIVVEGPPQAVAECAGSYTGEALRDKLSLGVLKSQRLSAVAV